MSDHMSVLLVDDNENLLGVLTERMTLRHVHVTTTTSGHDALELIKRNDFDVVLLDLRLPGLSGEETLKRIKSQRPDLDVVVLTGFCSRGTRDRCSEAGAFQVLEKPQSVNRVIAALERAYRQKSRRRSHGGTARKL